METLTPRGYQLEMVELSLRGNIVVAIPTGGGKTLIAARSIEAELERGGKDKRVWFLCPTVVLAHQQHSALRRELPEIYELLTLTGDDNVDRWGSQSVWNRVLHNISVVICTYQVLKDALESGFVRLREISLLVFDEAHVCQKQHAGNRIMQGYYHPAKKKQEEVPRVLGLTASLIGSSLSTLETIENNLDAMGRSPKLSYDELLHHVYLPSLTPMVYPLANDAPPTLLEQLDVARLRLIDGKDADPYVVHLRSYPNGLEDIAIAAKLEKALEKGKTWCIEQAKRLWAVAQETHQELGYWSLYSYFTTCLEKMTQLQLREALGEDSLRQKELLYFNKAFEAVEMGKDMPDLSRAEHHSPKVNLLINALVDEMQPGVTGILFVKTRAAVKLLSILLSTHPATRDILRIGTFVGGSSNQKGTQHICELIDGRGQTDTLEELRSGTKNLVVATSVVEEGIDISACNFVMCFDPPSNLRSFIQRRGRARKEQSKYIIMFSEKGKNKIHNWQLEEEKMKQMYQDDMRKLRGLEMLESEDTGHREYVVECTGAKLTLHDSVTRLHHFCDRIPADGYSTREPVYVYTSQHGTDLVKCEVHLPNGVHDSVRRHMSRDSWRSEKLARMDAAFEAVLALHRAQLIDDHLVPLDLSASEVLIEHGSKEARPNMIRVDEELSLWPEIADEWAGCDKFHTCLLTVFKPSDKQERVMLVSSRPICPVQDLSLHMNRDSGMKLQFHVGGIETGEIGIKTANEITRLLLRAGLRNRIDADKLGFPVLCLPFESLGHPTAWLNNMSGSIPGVKLREIGENEAASVGVIREIHTDYAAHKFYGTEDVLSEVGDRGTIKTMLRVQKWSRRTDFLHAVSADADAPSTKLLTLDPRKCVADRIPVKWAEFAKLIPTIYHYMHIHWIADRLRTTLLPEAFPKDEHVSLVLTAISASSARSTTDYQRLEFLGDTLLKFYVTLAHVTNHPLWHEGYLSKAKEYMVSNANLAAVAERLGLGQYILSKPFTGAKWRPPYNEDLQHLNKTEETEKKQREMSTKVLADVVEALLGAAWEAGGEGSLLSCLRVFFPKVEWRPSKSSLEIIRDRTPEIAAPEPYTSRLTELVSHQFQNPAVLLEAMTHPGLSTASTPSYQRLEFLGDALLDLIVVLRIWSYPVKITERWMHRVRTATVNGPLLSIAALSHHIEVHTEKPIQETDDSRVDDENPTMRFSNEVSEKSLVSFLRSSNAVGINTALNDSRDRFEYWGPRISELFEVAKTYPWTELAAFNPPKFLSDIVESVVAAIAVDRGDLGLTPGTDVSSPVVTFLDRLGLLDRLQRILDDAGTSDFGGPFNVWHPMEQAGALSDTDPVRYEIVKLESHEAGTVTSPLRKCDIFVADRLICSTTGRSEGEVKTRAAEMAVAILRKERLQSAGGKRKRESASDTQSSSDSRSSDGLSASQLDGSSEMPSQGDSIGSSQALVSPDEAESPTKKLRGLQLGDSQERGLAGA